MLTELRTLQLEIRDLVGQVKEPNYSRQFHPDLSPIGWHLGHCVYTETYWVKNKLNQETIEDGLKQLYVPELSVKQTRATALPDKKDLLSWVNKRQAENYALLHKKIEHPLLINNYLIHFLIQHYCQHIETMYMILTEMTIREPDYNVIPTHNLESTALIDPVFITVKAGNYAIGTGAANTPYDNEHCAHKVRLDEFKIASSPVSNGEFLYFMNSGGYSNKAYWSASGRDWLKKNNTAHPHHWRQAGRGNWYGIDHNGPCTLNKNEPVSGLCYFEAEACAKFLDARLPHEYEWETAFKKNVLKQTARCWEWCSNTLHPYPEFAPYPYAGYSVPYFDNNHYVLKGGSRHTRHWLKRPTFRNYYTPDKRHVFAGFRLVA